MEKITICGKEYPIECNAFTRVLYKQKFNKGIFEDIGDIQDFNNELDKIRQQEKTKEDLEKEINSYTLKNLDRILDTILKITYIEILTSNPKFESYEEWLRNISNINMNDEWTEKVMALATDCFRG